MFCYCSIFFVFRNVPQAAMSMKQGNWDRKKVSRDFSLFKPACVRATVCTGRIKRHYCCVVDPIVQPVITNQMWHLDLCSFWTVDERHGLIVLLSNITVHGCRAVWQGTWNSWTWKNRKGGRLKNAVVWHEGMVPFLCRLFALFDN